jgi:anaerobic magnesium-protoporphyrin IX monomethyl ester cyclase
MADITLVNANMLYVRYLDSVEREYHVPLGPLYLTKALEDAGYDVDFRDYQRVESDDPFQSGTIADFMADPAPVVGVSCMTNLLPFAILGLKEFKERHPDTLVVLGGVAPMSIEEKLLQRFPWIDVISRGEGERTIVALMRAVEDGRPLDEVPGIFFRRNGEIVRTPAPERITDLDSLGFPAFHKVDLSAYDGYGMVTSRGCPYPCTFCSVAPIWGHTPYFRSNESIIAEMQFLHREAGTNLFLFQDEFFVSSKQRVVSFCEALERSGLDVMWKAFGRIDLTDRETMQAMERTGCVELRYGVESGSDRVLEKTKKGFTAAEAVEVVGEAVGIFRRVDAFYVWGFPFETMEDFHQSLFQMIAFRMQGARILPSLLCLLPQTEIYREEGLADRLEFCRELFPEYMITGHEISHSGRVSAAPEHAYLFDFIEQHPDLFPGFFHVDLENNIFPKLKMLQEFGFYPADEAPTDPESCGAHSPRVAGPQERMLTVRSRD